MFPPPPASLRGGGVELKDPKSLTYNSGWLAGFIDTDGSVYLNEASGQIFITAVQKNRFILEALVELYGGTIYPYSSLSLLSNP